LPLLFGLKLFESLAQNSPDGVSPSFQLCSRWSYLATVYKLCGKVNEAVLATVTALVFNAQENSEQNDDPFSRLFLFICSHAKGIISVEYKGDDECEPHSVARARLVMNLMSMLNEQDFVLGDDLLFDSKNYSASVSVGDVVEYLLQSQNGEKELRTTFKEIFAPGSSIGLLQRLGASMRSSPAVGFLVELFKIILELFGAASRCIQKNILADYSGNLTLTTLNTFISMAGVCLTRYRLRRDDVYAIFLLLVRNRPQSPVVRF
jgi:hypothetical protein